MSLRGLLLSFLAILWLWPAAALAQVEPWQSHMVAGVQAYHQGNYPEAEKHLVAAVKEAEGFGPQDPRLATSLNNLALLYYRQGEYIEAEPLYLRALAIDEKALGSDHPALAIDLNNLAELYRAQSKFGEAEPLYLRALVIAEMALGPDHTLVATILRNLERLYYAEGKYVDAGPLVPRVVGRWYDFHEFGCHLGNVGQGYSTTETISNQGRH